MIHETAILHHSVRTGKNVSIGAYTVIEEGVIIGDNVTIQGAVRIGKHCTIGNDCIIKWASILTQRVVLEPRVFFGVRSTVLGSDSDRIDTHGTIIGADCYIGGHSIIFPCASITAGCIIGAGSIIRNPLQRQGTYVGLSKLVQ